MVKIGIIGCGVLGTTMKNWLQKNNPECKLFISDPQKGYNDDLSDINIAFIQIHIPTEIDGTQNLTILVDIINNLPDVPIFVRTTILPGTSNKLSEETKHRVYFMPEFLTERTCEEDFNNQSMIFTGEVNLLSKIFIKKDYIVMTSLEAELTKYMHNVFGALKVTYFNACYDYCKSLNANWENVHKGILLSGYINYTHTQVPGPDNKFGYGGKCFPKDVDAFTKKTEGTPLGTLLKPIHKLNSYFHSLNIKLNKNYEQLFR